MLDCQRSRSSSTFVRLGLVGALAAGSSCGLAVPGAAAPEAVPDLAAGPPGTLVVLPDDGSDQILGALAAGRRRVWIEVYMLTDSRVLGALAAAHAGGVEVRVLLEPAPYGDGGANQAAFLALQQDGIDVRWFAVPGGLAHVKLLLVDDRALVLTANLTQAGLNRNREYAYVDSAQVDVRRAESVFQADAIGAEPGSAPADTRIIVSPTDARLRLEAALDAATTAVALEIEEISDAELVARLLAARARGVAVSVVVPGANRSTATDQAVAALAAGGVGVRVMETPTLHAKAMVIDDAVAYLGSVNFTRASLDDNREVGVLLADMAVVERMSATLRHDWASAGAW